MMRKRETLVKRPETRRVEKGEMMGEMVGVKINDQRSVRTEPVGHWDRSASRSGDITNDEPNTDSQSSTNSPR